MDKKRFVFHLLFLRVVFYPNLSRRKAAILLTIPRRSWYHQPAKKPASCWSSVLKQEKIISATEFRVNEGIRVPEVRLIGPNGENLGVVSMKQALQIARDAELDVVEVSPNATPPVWSS